MLPVLIAVRGRVGSTAPKRCELGEVDAVVHEVCKSWMPWFGMNVWFVRECASYITLPEHLCMLHLSCGIYHVPQARL